MTAPGENQPINLVVEPLTENLLDDFLLFFDTVAFTDNPEWAGCYCHFYHASCSDRAWEKRSKEDNRNGSMQLILSGAMRGYLAYLDGKPAGWCNVNRKTAYPKLMASRRIADPAFDSLIASIVCFVVAPSCRDLGVARRLLQRVCADYSRKELAYLEAYPRKGKTSPARNYHGSLSMYLKEGFTVIKELKEYCIVRKAIRRV